MGRLNDGAAPYRAMSIGETRNLHNRDKTTKEIISTYTLTRTARPYVDDLCSAYNAGIDTYGDDPRWYVAQNGELKIVWPTSD